MARTPKIRLSFRNDTGFLVRLADAIERDVNRSPAFKTEALSHVNALIKLFVKEDTKEKNGDKADGSKRNSAQ